MLQRTPTIAMCESTNFDSMTSVVIVDKANGMPEASIANSEHLA